MGRDPCLLAGADSKHLRHEGVMEHFGTDVLDGTTKGQQCVFSSGGKGKVDLCGFARRCRRGQARAPETIKLQISSEMAGYQLCDAGKLPEGPIASVPPGHALAVRIAMLF